MRRKSIWRDKGRELSFPGLDKEIESEIVIIGGGITGLTAALQLTEAGRNVVVLEAYEIGAGTTGLSSCHLTTDSDYEYRNLVADFNTDTAKTVALSRMTAIDFVEATVKKFDIACDFRRVPGYLYTEIPEDISTLQEEHLVACRAGLDISLVESLPLPFPVEKALKFYNQAEFNSQEYLRGLALNTHLLGGHIFENSLVTSVKNEDGHFLVKTPKGSVKATYVFVATHLPLFLNVLQTVSAPYISYMVAARLRSPEYPVGLFWDMADPYHYTRFYTNENGSYVVVGGEDHKTGHESDPKARIQKLEQYVRQRFDIVSVDYRWSAQYYEPADGLPYIGKSPFMKNMFVSTGYSGDGLVYGTIGAIIVSDMILERENAWHKVYDSTRFTPAASAVEFIKENADVMKNFVKDRFVADPGEVADIKPGEGKIISVNGEKLAVSKNEDDSINAVSPVCPHMKCYVHYNNFENTWDCPCHGSRFNNEGQVIYGPSTHSLEKKEIMVEQKTNKK